VDDGRKLPQKRVLRIVSAENTNLAGISVSSLALACSKQGAVSAVKNPYTCPPVAESVPIRG